MSMTLALCSLMFALTAPEVNPYDQSKIPIEVDAPAGAKVAKIVLIAGSPSHPPGAHEYLASQAILAGLLEQNKGVHVTIVRDNWPKNPKILEGARTIVWYTDGAKNHPLLQADRAEAIQKHIDKGGGLVGLHYGINIPEELSAKALTWFGGHFDAKISAGSGAIKWTPEFKTLPKHPVTRGVTPFAINDEWYFNMRFVPDMKGITPIIKAVPPEEMRAKSEDAKKHPGRAEVVAWTFDRPKGGRSFAITTPHLHEDWANEGLRRLVVNAILWTAKVEVPAGGAKVALDPAELKKNLDDKRPKATTAAAPAAKPTTAAKTP
jgi:type 1 glutamine amidotransferase